jgi:DNA-binding NtrC family response regulator
VLLVDDDENLLHALTRSLRRQPYQIFTARSGSEAVWVLKTNDVDVLVADEQMPGMSGSDLLAWVAENYPDTMRIMLTGQASATVAIRAINEGKAYHFFTKPCDHVQLALMIRKAIEHRALVRENQRLLAANQEQLREVAHTK